MGKKKSRFRSVFLVGGTNTSADVPTAVAIQADPGSAPAPTALPIAPKRSEFVMPVMKGLGRRRWKAVAAKRTKEALELETGAVVKRSIAEKWLKNEEQEYIPVKLYGSYSAVGYFEPDVAEATAAGSVQPVQKNATGAIWRWAPPPWSRAVEEGKFKWLGGGGDGGTVAGFGPGEFERLVDPSTSNGGFRRRRRRKSRRRKKRRKSRRR